MARIGEWCQRVQFCVVQGCSREADNIDRGQLVCSRHLNLLLEVSRAETRRVPVARRLGITS